jgi:hypothetical protein
MRKRLTTEQIVGEQKQDKKPLTEYGKRFKIAAHTAK